MAKADYTETIENASFEEILKDLTGQTDNGDDTIFPDFNEIVEEKTETPTPEIPIEDFETIVDEIVKDEKVEEEKQEEGKGSFTSAHKKANVEFLIEKFGLGDRKEDIIGSIEDWDEEGLFEQFLEDLVDHQINTKYDAIKNSNDDLKAVLDLVERGGSVEQLMDYRLRKKEIENIDVSTPDGKIYKIKKYYRDVLKKDEEWINDHLELVQNKNRVEKEFEDVDKSYSEHLASKRDEIVDRQKEYNEKKERYNVWLSEEFGKVLDGNSVDPKKKKELNDFVFNDKKVKVVGTGQLISDFERSILEIKKDPSKLYDLVHYLTDQEGYKNKIVTEFNNQRTQVKFKDLLKKESELKRNPTSVPTPKKEINRKFEF